MKKNKKLLIPALALSAVVAFGGALSSGTNAIASENSTAASEDNFVFSLINEDGYLLFPVRAVFEQLGFNVNYEPNTKVITLTKGAQYVTFSTTKDAYTFARMAEQPLGKAPVVIDGVTYVPVTLLTDIMQMEGVSVSGTYLIISVYNEDESTEVVEMEEMEEIEEIEETKVISSQIIITDIDEDNNTITIEDPEKGTVILNIESTEINFDTEEEILTIGQAVEIEYGDIMTASMPPSNTPKSITVVDRYYEAVVLNIEEDEGIAKIYVNSEEKGDVILIVDPNEFDITNIEEGQILKVVMKNAMTMSIPPQVGVTYLSVINTEDKAEADEEASNVTILSVDKENNTVNIQDETLGEVVLNISEDTEIIFEDGAKSDWMQEGNNLKVVYSKAMTRSIPPINSPVQITVLK